MNDDDYCASFTIAQVVRAINGEPLGMQANPLAESSKADDYITPAIAVPWIPLGNRRQMHNVYE